MNVKSNKLDLISKSYNWHEWLIDLYLWKCILKWLHCSDCPAKQKAVCADDGKTYYNQCHLDAENCMTRGYIRKVSDGFCNAYGNYLIHLLYNLSNYMLNWTMSYELICIQLGSCKINQVRDSYSGSLWNSYPNLNLMIMRMA